MDIKMEEKIAKAFICKNRQKRFIFELSKRRRLDVICKLPQIIDKSRTILHSNKFPSPTELIKTMQSYGVKDMCYVLSEYSNAGYDGVYVPLLEAVEKLHTNGFPSLIVGLPSGFSHLKEESYASSQPNCFVKPLLRFDGVPWGKQNIPL